MHIKMHDPPGFGCEYEAVWFYVLILQGEAMRVLEEFATGRPLRGRVIELSGEFDISGAAGLRYMLARTPGPAWFVLGEQYGL